jgi:hypothetical protein
VSDDDPAPAAPVRPVAVLDTNVLIPAGLRDLMLSCADVGVFRPVWQAEIEDEVVRNTARLAAERHGIDLDQARAGAEATMAQIGSTRLTCISFHRSDPTRGHRKPCASVPGSATATSSLEGNRRGCPSLGHSAHLLKRPVRSPNSRSGNALS